MHRSRHRYWRPLDQREASAGAASHGAADATRRQPSPGQQSLLRLYAQAARHRAQPQEQQDCAPCRSRESAPIAAGADAAARHHLYVSQRPVDSCRAAWRAEHRRSRQPHRGGALRVGAGCGSDERSDRLQEGGHGSPACSRHGAPEPGAARAGARRGEGACQLAARARTAPVRVDQGRDRAAHPGQPGAAACARPGGEYPQHRASAGTGARLAADTDRCERVDE